MSVLLVCDVECRGAVFHLASQEREVHIVYGYKEGLVPSDEVTNERQQLSEPVISERVSPKPNRVVGLGTGASKGDRVVPPFVDARY